ncbi:MAG: DUF2264 domain-containing protein [Spirochaetales bacterium]
MNRHEWISVAEKLSRPALEAAAVGRLHEALAPEHHHSVSGSRLATAKLETIGRLFAGIAPWLELADHPQVHTDQTEIALRDELRDLMIAALGFGSDPEHPDYLGFANDEPQLIVDAAFLAHGFLRAPSMWTALDGNTRARFITGFLALRARKPYFNNWLLFSALAEAFLHSIGRPIDPMRVDYAVRQHEQWYLGDGTYADGPSFHCDYYNSFVIHPMLMDTLETVASLDPHWAELGAREAVRFERAAVLQERMIAPDGTWPVVGRSTCYRCGAFQTLAQAALQGRLPESLPPGQVRGALSATIKSTFGEPGAWRAGTFRADGFLRIGLSGHQPSLGEPYITTGSLYLASLVLLPLGLASDHAFWRDPESPWTSVRAFHLSQDLPADHAI